MKSRVSHSTSMRYLWTFFLITIPVTIFGVVRLRKQSHYRWLSQQQKKFLKEYEPHLRYKARKTLVLPSFADRIAVIPDFLPAETFAQLKSAIVKVANTERTYLPAHKQGGTVAYETLHEVAPPVVAFFNSPYLRALFSEIVGEAVQPTPTNDQSSCSLLFYTKPGDHINWHYDHNFYHGRHFTVLLPIVNQHNDNPAQISSAKLMVRKQGEEEYVSSTPNTLILFEGARVLHKVTRLGADETRIILSMTFCTTQSAPLAKSIIRRFKDVAFFGLRALWT